jgi:hypothetical protein
MLFYRTAHKSSKKLLEQCQKLEKVWSHVFTSSLTLNGGDAWYRKLRELIDKHQSSPTWVSETKVCYTLNTIFHLIINLNILKLKILFIDCRLPIRSLFTSYVISIL